MKFKHWYNQRGPIFLSQRAGHLLARYGISPDQAIERTDSCLEGLLIQDCKPTFFTPGIVLERYPEFIRHLQARGAEIAVHGYQHADLRAYPLPKAVEQLIKAVDVFKTAGIKTQGFRCPYLGYSDELINSLPDGLFDYSSNHAIYWNETSKNDGNHSGTVFETLRKIYHAESSNIRISVPWKRTKSIEIPVCMPDDMELIDGLNASAEEVSQVWVHILKITHRRGELFNLIFHPELAEFCEQPFHEILSLSKTLQPNVWITRLGDLGSWWNEKSNFKFNSIFYDSSLVLDFSCSPRATILAKGLSLNNSVAGTWDGAYQILKSRHLTLPATPLPFIGVSPDVPDETTSFLEEQGYLLDRSDTAPDCSIFLEASIIDSIRDRVGLIEYIESNPGPLVRYWRWPFGAKSALSITGDLDALSLMDYISRIFT